MLSLAGKILIGFSLSAPALLQAEDLGKILEVQSSQELAIIQKERRALLTSLMGTDARGAFGDAFVQGQWQKALRLWGSEIEGQAFAHSDNGTALLGLILFANRFEVLGVETLLSVKDPTGVFSGLKAKWKKVVANSSPVWKWAQGRWHPEWTKTFGVAAKVRAMGQRLRGEEDLSLIHISEPTRPY